MKYTLLALFLLFGCGEVEKPELDIKKADVLHDERVETPPPVVEEEIYIPRQPSGIKEIPLPKRDNPWDILIPHPKPKPPPCPICL